MNIPIVQGTAVDSKYQAAGNYAAAVPSGDARAPAARQCNDVIWAVLFVVHLVVILGVLAANFSLDAIAGNGDGSAGLVTFTGITGAAALGLGVAAMGLMKTHAEPLVKAALIFSVGFSLAMGVMGFMSGSMLMGILGLASFAIGCCYAYMVWSRIPFAAVMLKTSLTAVQANMGLVLLSLFLSILAFAWTMFWILGTSDALAGSNEIVIFFLFLSFYWVHEVLQNSMHVTAAGVVGTWWWVPIEASSFCSSALWDSITRTFTYSFGSVCLGSLLVAIVQALRALERHSRDSDAEGAAILRCVIQCILECIESIIEFINRWAYVYVGLYGFSYMEAGRSVFEMFRAKGYTAIITDNLGENVIFMVTMAIGLATGFVGLGLASMNQSIFAAFAGDDGTVSAGMGFGVGLAIGVVFSSVVLSVVGSAVNTVVVCYVEDPAAFQRNHPELSDEMRAAWATSGWEAESQ